MTVATSWILPPYITITRLQVSAMTAKSWVMYGGKIQEVATVIDLFDNPKHPYTLGLLGSIPHLQDKGSPLDAIPGIVPSIFEYPPGCRFQSRCVHAMDRCRTEEPALHTIAPGHQVRCHLMEDEAKEAR